MKLGFLLVTIFLIVPSGSDAGGAVVDLDARAWWEGPWDPRLPTQLLSWDFDVDTQTLTLSQAFYRMPTDSNPWDDLRIILVAGYAQGPSTFTVIENISNMTATPWTGYELVFGTDHSDDITSFVLGSAISDKFSEASSRLPVIFTGGVVLPGETLTIQYDVFTDSPLAGRGTRFNVYGTPVPEPGTMVVLGCGAVLTLRNRRKCRAASLEK